MSVTKLSLTLEYMFCKKCITVYKDFLLNHKKQQLTKYSLEMETSVYVKSQKTHSESFIKKSHKLQSSL